jgi:hypothetical protein
MQMKMEPRNVGRQKQKMRRRLIVIGVSSFLLLAVGIFFLFNIGNIRKGFADNSKPDIQLKMYPNYSFIDGATYLDVAIYAKNIADSARLGTSSIVIKYNSDNLKYVSIIPSGSNYNGIKYLALTSSPYGNSSCSVETNLSTGPGASVYSIGKGSLVGILRFSVRNVNSSLGLAWSDDKTGYSAIFKDDDKTQFVVSYIDPPSVTPLPANLVDFTAELKDGVTEIKWSTSSEYNSKLFTVERSSDAINFESVFTKDGYGTTTVTHEYSGSDEKPLSGTSYYRLKLVDNDANTQTFNIVDIHNEEIGDIVASVNPTAFIDNTTLAYKISGDGTVVIKIVSLSGKTMSEVSVTGSKGDNTYKIGNTSGWDPGLYLVNITFNGKSYSAKMIKQ